MLTDQGLALFLDRLERGAIDRDLLKKAERYATREKNCLEVELEHAKEAHRATERRLAEIVGELETVRADYVSATTARDRAQNDLALLRNKPPAFPRLIDPKAFVYVAFENSAYELTAIADDQGSYQNAGNIDDFAALVAAPLNQRCYLTCHRLGLFRLAAAPVGKLKLDDDIPF